MHRIRRALLGLFIGTSLCASTVMAQGASGVTFEFQEDGSDVLLTGSGFYDLLGALSLGQGFQGAFFGEFGLSVGEAEGPTDLYALSSNSGAFGTIDFVEGSGGAGGLFGLDFLGIPGTADGFISVPQGFQGGSVSGSTRFTGQSFATLGLIEGSYQYAIPNTAITVNIVPEPGVLGLLGMMLLVGAVMVRRRAA